MPTSTPRRPVAAGLGPAASLSSIDVATAIDAALVAYDAGLYRDAIDAGRVLGDLRLWPSARGRVTAARIASRTGRPRLAQALFFRAFREYPDDSEAVEFWCGSVLHRRGPSAALSFLRGRPEFATRPRIRSIEAVNLAVLRDFDRAERAIDEALAAEPDAPWLHVQRATVLELADRVDEALATIAHARTLVDGYQPALLREGHMLAHLGRHREALALLRHPRTERSFELLSLRAEMHYALGDRRSAATDLAAARAETVDPDKRVSASFASRQSEVAYLLGEHARAAAFARELGTPHALAMADRIAALRESEPPPRRELDAVPHVRQRHVTCAPASLAAVAQYHGDALDHLTIAGAICYAGTPAHHARAYVEERGHHAAELDVTVEIARALVDHGLPFVLTTVATSTAHAQVVIGYDLVRETLLIRDPSSSFLVEMPFEELARQAFHGPHGLVFAPKARAAEIDALPLPSRDAWEHRHRLARALERHDLRAARACVDAIEAIDPVGVHACAARLELARYRADRAGELVEVDALRARFPEARSLLLQRANLMIEHAPREETVALLRAHEASDDPALLETLGELLRTSPGDRAEAARLLRRARRIAPTSGTAHHILADVEVVGDHDPVEVLASYRYAACLSDAQEHYARAYYDYAARNGEEPTALEFLERRVEATRERSAAPATTLFEVHADAGHPELGVETLERLAARRPSDGDLLLTLVDAYLTVGDPSRARSTFRRAEELPAREAQRLAVRAKLARLDGRLEDAEADLRAACVESGDRPDLVADHAELVATLRGPDEGRAVFEAARARQPNDASLLRNLCVFLRGRDDARARELLAARLEECPDDAWCRRELAECLTKLGRFDDAIGTAREAARLEPRDVYARSILGSILERVGDVDGARAALREAVAIDVDLPNAVYVLGTLPGDPEDRRADARYVLDLVEARRASGASISEAAALGLCLPEEELNARLTRILENARQHPDAYEAVASAYMDSGRYDEAGAILDEAIGRFPRWFRLRELRARLLGLRGETDAQERELLALLSDAPHLSRVRASLARAYRARGAHEAALATAEQGLRAAPWSALLLDVWASALASLGRVAEAYDGLFRGLAARALDDAAFRRLASHARGLGRVAEVEKELRAQAEADPRSPMPHRRLWELLDAPERADDALADLRTAVARGPRDLDTLDLLAQALCEGGRYDEALSCCPPAEWVGPVPLTMRGRRADIRARQGRTKQAIDEALALLGEWPDYVWLRVQLCDWLDSSGQTVAFLEHARELARRAPNSARSHVYLADALHKNGERMASVDAFARALELDPSYAYAATRIAALLLEDDDVARAAQTFERVRHSLAPSESLAFSARIAAKQGRWDDALAAFASMLERPAASDTVSLVLETLSKGPVFDAALERVERELASPNPPVGPEIGRAYAEIAYAHRRRRALRVFDRVDSLGPAGEIAGSHLLEELGRARDRLSLLVLFARRRAVLRAKVWLWGAMGYVLLVLGMPRFTRAWLARDATRPDARPWMLLNLVSAAWTLGSDGLAAQTARRALELPRDHASDRHQRWVLFDDLLTGRARAVADAMEGLPCAATDAESALLPLARVIETARARVPSVGVIATFDEVRGSLQEVFRRGRTESEVRAAYAATLRCLAREHGIRMRILLFFRGPFLYD